MDKESTPQIELQDDMDSIVQPGESWDNPGEFPEFKRSSEKETKEGLVRLDTAEKRLEELRVAEIPEGKFKIPDKIFDDIARDIEEARKNCESPHFLDWYVLGVESRLKQLESLTGEVDKEVGDKLWSLYEDPEISIGAHGTAGGRDTDFGKESGVIMTYGLGCASGDIRRTVSFQDRGKIHAHGNLSFLSLLSYSYDPFSLRKKNDGLMAEELRRDQYGGLSFSEEIPASRYTVIVAIPKSFSVDIDEYAAEERVPIRHGVYAHEMQAKAIRPEFIVGIVQDGRVNDVVWNPGFDADHIREMSRERRLENEAKAAEEAQKAKEAERVVPEPVKKERIMKKFLKKFGRKNERD